MCLNIKICANICADNKNISNFQTLEVVARGSETQPQDIVVENFNKLI